MSAPRAADELLVTREGYAELCAELEPLRTDGRRAMTERLQEARADRHLADNPALLVLRHERATGLGSLAALLDEASSDHELGERQLRVAV